jgi:hypothetical protein
MKVDIIREGEGVTIDYLRLLDNNNINYTIKPP